MKNSFVFLTAFAFLPSFVKAQTDPVVVKQFPAAVIWRISDICSKVTLPMERQVTLGKYFRRQDDLANQAMLRGDKTSVLERYYQISADSLKMLLQPLEYNDYQVAVKAKSSRLRSVVTFRKVIGLATDQVNELLKQGELLDELSKNKKTDAGTFERTEIQRILTNEQYKNYFFKISEPGARKNAQSDFNDLIKNKLCQASDSVKIYPDLYKYELTRSATLGMVQYLGDKKEYDKCMRSFDVNKPVWLYRLSAANANTPKWRVLYVIYNKNELQLSQKQIDTLIRRNQQMCKQDFEQRYGKAQPDFTTKTHENQTLLTTLTPTQLTTYLHILNSDPAKKNAQKDWDRLKKYKLAADTDKEKIINELQEYRLKLLVAEEMNIIEKNKKNSFLRQDILDNKPAILKALEMALKKEKEEKIIRF